MSMKKFTKLFILTTLLINATNSFSMEDSSVTENNFKSGLNYELKIGITPYETYGSSSNSERYNKGVDFGMEVYKPFEGYSLGFGGEVRRKIDTKYIVGDTSRLYSYYFLGKKEITDSYSLVTRLGRTSQKEFDSKFYGAIGLEKSINRINIQLLLEKTKLENSLNNKDYTSVGLKVGYVFGDQYRPKLEAPIIVEEAPKAPIPMLSIQGDELTGGYPAYITDVPVSQKENILEVVNKLNEYDKAGALQLAAYSDNTGSKPVNVDLANKRMDNLMTSFKDSGLTEKVRVEKIDPETTVKSIYKVDNDTFENRKLNRRIEVTFIED